MHPNLLDIAFFMPRKKTIRDFNPYIVKSQENLIKAIDIWNHFPSFHPIMRRISTDALILLGIFNCHSLKRGFNNFDLERLCEMMTKPNVKHIKNLVIELIDAKLIYKNNFCRLGVGKISEYVTAWRIHLYLKKSLITHKGNIKRPTMPKERLDSILNYAVYIMSKKEFTNKNSQKKYIELMYYCINTLTQQTIK